MQIRVDDHDSPFQVDHGLDKITEARRRQTTQFVQEIGSPPVTVLMRTEA